MLASLLIVFREVFEAGLIIGVVLAATEGLAGRMRWIAGGVAGGLAGAGLLALFAGRIGNALGGSGQEVFNATILLLAVGMLAWHHLWMAEHGRDLTRRIKALGADIQNGRRSLAPLAVVVGIAVLREGAEVVLFLYGVAVSSPEGPVALIGGGLGGLVLGAGVAFGLYRGLVAIPVKRLFAVTEVMLTVLAAGLAGQALALLGGAGILPSLGDEVWNTSGVLREDSLIGRALHALVGYADRPSGIQIIAYVATLALFFAGARLVQRAHPAPARMTAARS